MNLMRTMKLIVGQSLANGRELRPARSTAGFAAQWAVIGLLLAGCFPSTAQEPDAPAQTSEMTDAEVLARIGEMVQAAQSGQPEDMAASNEVAATNGLARTDTRVLSSNRFERGGHGDNTNRLQSSNRSQPDDRRSRSRRSFRSRSDQTSRFNSSSDYNRGGERAQANAPAGANDLSNRLDYAAFKIIVDRNIFDPNRYPHARGGSARPPPKTVDSLTLVGTMTYERGSFAFFDGTSSDYKKALKLNDLIAGYKVTNIAPNSVKLAAGTNEMEMRVGMQLRREESGPWSLSSQAGSYATVPASSSTNTVAATTGSDTASNGEQSDIIKKLMQRRQQE